MTIEQAIEHGKSQLEVFGGEHREFIKLAIKALEQEPRKGHWTEHPHEWGDDWQYSDYECSICHKWTHFEHDFCPNCGAKMAENEGKK